MVNKMSRTPEGIEAAKKAKHLVDSLGFRLVCSRDGQKLSYRFRNDRMYVEIRPNPEDS